ncbi:hypothetical protein ACFW04_013613 [Cataglyphis niger]
MTPTHDHLVRSFLTKRSLRKSISVNERVAVTFLFLAHGNSVRSKSWDFRIGKSTIYKIIYETCDAIWQALQAQYLPKPLQEKMGKGNRWILKQMDFPNYIGALDGKHITIQASPNSSNSDDGVWANSNIGQSLESDTGNIPSLKLLPGTTTLLPCTLVGDEVFPLKSYLMRHIQENH